MELAGWRVLCVMGDSSTDTLLVWGCRVVVCGVIDTQAFLYSHKQHLPQRCPESHLFSYQEPMETTGAFSTQGNTWWLWRQRATPPPPRPVKSAMTWELPSVTSPSPKPTWQESRRSWRSLGSSRSACPSGGSGRGLGSGGSSDRPQPRQNHSNPWALLLSARL